MKNKLSNISLTLGLGCDRNTPATTLQQAITEALNKLIATLNKYAQLPALT